MHFLKKLSLLFSAGCVGGLVNSLVVWAFGLYRITGSCGVKIAPALTKTWLYPRIVWGGIWGVALILPIIRRSMILRGMVMSIAPTLVTLLIFFPSGGQGMWGLGLGKLTPVFVLFFNAVWGMAAGAWYALTSRNI